MQAFTVIYERGKNYRVEGRSEPLPKQMTARERAQVERAVAEHKAHMRAVRKASRTS